MASAADELPYGVCPERDCPYSVYGLSESGNKLSCPDHAKLHAYIDHGYSVQKVNLSEFDNSHEPFETGTRATTRLNPYVEASMPSILKGLEDLPKDVANFIRMCPGDLC